MKHPIGNTLDVLMVLLFRFLEKESSDEAGQCVFEKTKSIYSDMLKVGPLDCSYLGKSKVGKLCKPEQPKM